MVYKYRDKGKSTFNCQRQLCIFGGEAMPFQQCYWCIANKLVPKNWCHADEEMSLKQCQWCYADETMSMKQYL